MPEMKQFDVHGGIAFCDWDGVPHSPVNWEFVEVVSRPDNRHNHDDTVKLAWKFADDMAPKPEFQSVRRKALAVGFLAQTFSDMMHSKGKGSDAMMFTAYALLKIFQREHMIFFFNRETAALRWDSVSGKHEKAMEKLRDRVRTTTYQDFAIADQPSQPKH